MTHLRSVSDEISGISMQDMTTKPQLQEIDQQLGAMIEEIQSLREQLTKMGMAGTQELVKQHPRHNNVR